MDKAEIEAGVAAFPFWYHRTELPHDVPTPGWAPVQPATICEGELLVESANLDDFGPYRGGFGHGYHGARPCSPNCTATRGSA